MKVAERTGPKDLIARKKNVFQLCLLSEVRLTVMILFQGIHLTESLPCIPETNTMSVILKLNPKRVSSVRELSEPRLLIWVVLSYFVTITWN